MDANLYFRSQTLYMCKPKLGRRNSSIIADLHENVFFRHLNYYVTL